MIAHTSYVVSVYFSTLQLSLLTRVIPRLRKQQALHFVV